MLSPDDSDDDYVLSWNRGKTLVTCKVDPTNNLPTVYTTGEYRDFKSFVSAFKAFPNIIEDNDDESMGEAMPIESDSSDNESDDEAHSESPKQTPKKVSFEMGPNPKEPSISIDDPVTHRDEDLFLSWHLKLGHAPYRYIRWAAELGILPSKLKKVRDVICPACMYGKQKRRPWRTKGTTSQQGKIKKATRPGECVSVDQLISGVPGLVGQTTGRLTTSRYRVATIFVDHYSDLDYVHVQESTSAEDTIEGKRKFEQFCFERGVKVQHYHADNGIFASRGFREEVQRCGQKLTFCGVGAHHQNGVAERRIQDLCDSARSMLAHASHRNPAVNAHLWPYALRHASYTRRILPRQGHSKSPEELFTKSPVRATTKFLHPFGCPVYVLQAALQSGGTQPKWDDRSRVGINLGHSAQHAPSVSLILNPTTGYVSPQFHCVYDNGFDTPKKDKNFSNIWSKKAGLEPGIQTEPMLQIGTTDYSTSPIPDHFQVPFDAIDQTETTVFDTVDSSEDFPVSGDDGDGDEALIETMEPSQDPMPENEGAGDDSQQPEQEPRTTRSGRTIKRSQRLQESELLPVLQSFAAVVHHVTNVLSRLDDNSLNELTNLLAFPASLADSDTMYLNDALKQPDKDKFLEAMVKEIDDHTKRGHWRVTTKQEMTARGYKHKPIMAIWSFKRKRNPFGEITKYKARLCCHGGQTIQGVHYQDSYSPVVAWSTVRLMLTLSEVYGWHARQIDFVLAFPQAKVKTDIYMNVPEKFRVNSKGAMVLDESAKHPSKQDSCVKLIQNVYGLRDASLTWHEHISKGLLDFGFKRSETDPCLFIKGNVLFILYVDDAVCLTPNKADADRLIADLTKKGYILTDEGPLSAYLGIQVERLSGNRISMKQPAFIDRIIEQCHLKDQRMHDTPADTILNRDSEGQPRKNEFHYRSIIGQLNYLAATTRPEIQFAVHQCARFCEDPKMSHEKAVKRIVRYLKRTRDQGIIMHVDKSKGIECFVDADFAGGYQKHNTKNPRDCLSRTGFVIKYAGCPIVWSSKLQTTIALSTTEAEYMALSTATREVIYLMNLTDELRSHGVELIAAQPKIQCKVFEDNAGAIELARLPKLRPRTKHLAIQYHHFRSWTVKGLNGEEPRIKVQYISTEKQEADIFTKPLPRPQFQTLRRLLCGW
ncbi:MAG: reverse transcriptase domain-containing protein [Spirochaetales bacterium]|nr:reverse transcriptase domain-containing protein [Spirochaetales bacterium]